MSVNSKMTAIADAIREKTGGTDLLTLDDMAAAIAGIQAGGGGDVKIAIGKFWLYEEATVGNSASTGYAVEHGLDEVPTFFAIIRSDSDYGKGIKAVVCRACNAYWYMHSAASGEFGSAGTSYTDTYSASDLVTKTSFLVFGDSGSSFLSKGQYLWVAAVLPYE